MELIPDSSLSFAAMRQAFDGLVTRAFTTDESRAMLRLIYALEWPDIIFPRYADDQVKAAQAARILEIAAHLANGEPLQYVLGKATFLEHVLSVGPGVLIPRPETEELFTWIEADYRELTEPVHIADIGCGSGCLAVSLAYRFGSARVSAVDVSASALGFTSRNADNILGKGHQLQCMELDFLCEAMHIPQADLIVSNPPYIAADAVHEVDTHVQQHEPHIALYAPKSDALVFYRHLAEMLKRQGSGRLYVEINPHFATETFALFAEMPGLDVTLRKDMNGRDRMIRCIKKAP